MDKNRKSLIGIFFNLIHPLWRNIPAWYIFENCCRHDQRLLGFIHVEKGRGRNQYKNIKLIRKKIVFIFIWSLIIKKVFYLCKTIGQALKLCPW